MKAFNKNQNQQEEQWRFDEEQCEKAAEEERRISKERRHREEEGRQIWNAQVKKDTCFRKVSKMASVVLAARQV